jgi:hypothetical protein
VRTEPTPAERDWLLAKARQLLDHATGARKCECAKDKSAAEGLGVTFDPKCDCFRGYVSNPGWDGTREHFDALLPFIKSSMAGGTACIEPGTHPRDCHWYQVDSKALWLCHPSVLGSDSNTFEFRLTWNQVFDALTEPAQMELAL